MKKLLIVAFVAGALAVAVVHFGRDYKCEPYETTGKVVSAFKEFGPKLVVEGCDGVTRIFDAYGRGNCRLPLTVRRCPPPSR